MAGDCVSGAGVTLTNDQILRARAAAIAAGLPHLHSIIHAVCHGMGVSVADMKGHSKRDPLVIAARKQAAICAREAGFSWMKIGRAMNRDHSTIMTAVNKA